MQLLYAMDRDPELTLDDLERRYKEQVDQSFELLLFVVYVLVKICEQSIKDEKKRQAKHLPTEQDKLFEPCLYRNRLVQSLIENDSFSKYIKEYQFDKKIDADVMQQIYRLFAEVDEYKEYVLSDPEERDHLDILLSLFREVKKEELFTDLIEDHYANWVDDRSLIIGAVKKIIKRLPESGDFFEDYYPDDDTVDNLGHQLMMNVLSREEKLVELIEPVLNNWDVDRLALIDLILLKMAVSELLNFPTIPKKVTLNEYVEIAKGYSTPKSKDFINGILDNLMKDLDEQGMIQKKGRGLLNE